MSETPWSDLLMQRPGPRCLGPGIAVLMALSLVKVLYSGGILERRNVKEAMHAAIETVWPSNKVISSTSSEASPCFVRTGHVCSHGEGIGGLFRRMEWVIAIATRYHCAYVCHEADWPTGGHGTGNVGHLFGCSSNVTGDPSRVVAATAIKGLTTARVQLKYDGSPHYVLRYKYGQPLLRSSAWYVDPPQAQVWELNPPCREIFTVTHETTWRWIQQQFHFVRTAMGRSATAWGDDDDDDDADDADSRARRPGRRRRLRIALQLRRGDRPAACPLYLYLNALRDLSIALPWISVETTKILLIGQVNVTSEEFTCLKRLEAEILVVKNPKADVAPVALQSDLDHISSSDVLILGGGGSFTWLAATLQWRGIILHSQTKDSALDGLPHAYALDDTGRFPCNSSYNFSDYFAARPLDRSSGGSKFREQVELAMQDYMRWYEEAKPCEGPRGRDGFGIGRRCKPPVFSPACETTTASPCPSTAPTVPSPAAAVPNRATVPPSRWVNVTAALYPLDSRYVASSKACPAACLGKPGKDCEKRYCCKAKGSADTFETLSYEHVAFLRIRCQGNINHDFHQSFWPFFWWTAVYNNSDFAILVDRMAKHPNTSCPAAYWLDDLFWALSKANGWKVHNFSSTKEYCITGELHILEGLRNCCDYRLKPSALLRFAAPHFTFAVLGQLDQEYHRKALIYSRGLSSSWRRIRRPEDLRPLLRKDLDVEILADLPSTLVAQARLFASNGLVLAPNGGWAPNVIFMPLDSCLIELHLYQLDSWVQRYLLYSTIGEVLLIVGDYRDPEKKKIVRPKRIGGDDDFLVRGAKNNLYEDIYNEMARSHLCNAYLAK